LKVHRCSSPDARISITRNAASFHAFQPAQAVEQPNDQALLTLARLS
jgi:hypothetical protein